MLRRSAARLGRSLLIASTTVINSHCAWFIMFKTLSTYENITVFFSPISISSLLGWCL